MIRITLAQTPAEQRWTLCGQLTGAWVDEVRASWETREVFPTARTVVNLSEVTFIDEGGEKLLSEMRAAGAVFIACGVDTKHLLKDLMGKGERALRRCIAPPTSRIEKISSTTQKENE